MLAIFLNRVLFFEITSYWRFSYAIWIFETEKFVYHIPQKQIFEKEDICS